MVGRMYSSGEALLKSRGLRDVPLANKSGAGIIKTINWRQNMELCERCERYKECIYEAEDGREFFVFVAEPCWDSTGNPPFCFNTSGYKGKLHAGLLYQEANKDCDMVFFVIQPSDWKPYQHRFITDTLTKAIAGLVTSGAGTLAACGAKAAATAGACAALGTAVLPGVGTAVGAVAGLAVGAAGCVAAMAAGNVAIASVGHELYWLG